MKPIEKNYFVYILSSKQNRSFYIGSTNDICRRIYEHRNGKQGSFTNKYKISKLVHLELVKNKEESLKRERQIKKWNRAWKIELIKKYNPSLEDLYQKYCK